MNPSEPVQPAARYGPTSGAGPTAPSGPTGGAGPSGAALPEAGAAGARPRFQVGVGSPLTPQEILARLAARYGDKVRAVTPPFNAVPPDGPAADPRRVWVRAPYAVVAREHVSPILAHLRDDPQLRFDFLVDVTAVDHLLLEVAEIPERYAVVYQLSSVYHGHRIRVKTPVPEDDPRVPSVSSLWSSAIWGERETHDMFGIRFEGHPDLRRLLMPESYPGFPLRKDYPLRGRGERDSFPQHRSGAVVSDDRRTRPVV